MSTREAGAGEDRAPEGIRAVLFDFDDTLFAHRAAVDLGFQSYLATLEGPFSDADASTALTLWNTLEEQHFRTYLTGELDHATQRRSRAREFAAAHGVDLTDEESETWFERYFEHYAANWVLHDDVLDCLVALQRDIPGVRFGIVTNGELDYQSRKIDHVGLRERIPLIVASGAVQVAKPDPEIFMIACRRLGLEPTSVAYVGVRLRTDAIGAAHAGLTGIWLNRTGREQNPEEAAEATKCGVIEIRGLAELPAALSQLSE